MKISKIFHSLYAFLMLLPVCAVLGTTLYTILNPNAKDSYSGSVTHQEYQQVVSYLPSAKDNQSNILLGNYYEATDIEFATIDIDDYLDYQSNYFYFIFLVYSGDFSISSNSADVDDSPIYEYYSDDADVFLSYRYNYGISLTEPYVEVQINVTGDYRIIYQYVGDVTVRFDNCILCFDDYDYDTYEPVSNIIPVDISDSFNVVSIPQYSYELVEVEETTLDNAFSYSVNALYSNPLFSWCNNSFLSEPFHYIGDLFGLPRDNAINTLFSYWLNISIIWLCFDVIMYVPLLCHRWIDKGGLE